MSLLAGDTVSGLPAWIRHHARRFAALMRRLRTAPATASLLTAQAPVLAEGTADDIGVMGVSLKGVVKPDFVSQGEAQGAGTPN